MKLRSGWPDGLMMTADRVGTNSLALTQELLTQMLGTRRASVTLAAGILQKAESHGPKMRKLNLGSMRRAAIRNRPATFPAGSA